MLIKEFRVVLPITVPEYQVGQLYSVAIASQEETGGGEGMWLIYWLVINLLASDFNCNDD